MHVLGIDAGGTKTVCLLADGEGRVLAEARGRGANLQASGELEVEKVLHQVMEEALGEADIRPDVICLGIAGVDRPEDARAAGQIMRRIAFKSRVVVVNDALIALVAGAGNAPGVVLIAGTGSIAYGRDALGRAARAGGWGYLLGDEGGGFWIGRAAMAAVVRQFDGRGPATTLTELVLDQTSVASPAELIKIAYDRELARRTMVSLAPVVQKAVDAGDAVAAEILSRAGAELSNAAASVIARLGMRGDQFSIVLAGGMFHALPSLAADVTTRLSEVAPRADSRQLQGEPAAGAVTLALAAAKGGAVVPTYI